MNLIAYGIDNLTALSTACWYETPVLPRLCQKAQAVSELHNI